MIDGFNKKDLRAFVRIDGMGRVVAGSLILRRKRPLVGKWKEVTAYACCAPALLPPTIITPTSGEGGTGSSTTTTAPTTTAPTTTVAPISTTSTTIP